MHHDLLDRARGGQRARGQQEFAPDSMGQYMLPGFFLPAIAMVFNILANRFIRRDENLVRSVDRLR